MEEGKKPIDFINNMVKEGYFVKRKDKEAEAWTMEGNAETGTSKGSAETGTSKGRDPCSGNF